MRIVDGNSEFNLPDFLLVGAAKSGTTSVYHYLKAHSEVFMPDLKEPYFFCLFGTDTPVRAGLPPWTLESYAELFVNAGEGQVLGEATPGYLHRYEKSIENIVKVYGDDHRKVKIIAILRDPVERAWSHYILMRGRGKDRGFFEAIQQALKEERKGEEELPDFVRAGMYCEQIRAYRSRFPNTKLVLFEELRNAAEKMLKEIFVFLELEDTDFVPGNLGITYNVSGEPDGWLSRLAYKFWIGDSVVKNILKGLIPHDLRQRMISGMTQRMLRKEEIPQDVREYLSEIYRPGVENLEGFFRDPERKRIVNSWLG